MSKTPPTQSSGPPKSILQLVQRFAQHHETYKRQKYNETQVRREFIDPLFTALGWDVDNRAGHAEAYKDVIHEDAIKIGGSTKAPDYCFRIGGVRKFFVEAKKPAVPVKDDPGPAYQLRRYGWTAKLPLAIVTDFEEFAVYDCRIRPRPTDKPATARVIYITYDQYADRWGEIAAIFSKEAILQGSFDKYAESNRRKRGTAEVDTEFLKEIERWRELLARNIALRNPGLSVRDLNYAVSKTIDRLIFLRMCEDRGVETYAQLRILLSAPKVYDRLRTIFRSADERYNSGLFYFQPEKNRTDSPDELTPGLIIDDGVLKDIIKGLYYPECPYEFSVLPAEILGQVYEQFLGKVIRLTKGHRAVIEEKPEVKKAGGVYYTPTYIVDYIVKHTVGKLLEGNAPADVGPMLDQRQQSRKRKRPAPVLRVLDPACGSGSFLLGAYQYLLDWHLRWYADNDPQTWAKKKNPPIFQVAAPDPNPADPSRADPSRARKGATSWRLTVAERKRVLLNNLYGVDIDPQAVEVTKLSLLLKVLEGESQQTLENQLRLFHERALPDLAGNIKCGNSLIGPDFYDNEQMTLLDDEERYRINVFDWEAEFPQVFDQSPKRKRGVMTPSGNQPVAHAPGSDHAPNPRSGFDAVIGNPPYVRIQNMKEYAPLEVEHYKMRYKSAGKGNYDIYVVFVERGLSLLNSDGRLGMILPHKFFNAKYGEALRQLCTEGQHLAHVVHFTDEQVFAAATTYTCLLFLTKNPNPTVNYVRVEDLDGWRVSDTAQRADVSSDRFSFDDWNITIGPGARLFERLAAMPFKLDDCAHLFVGLQTDADDVFIVEQLTRTEGRVLCRSRATDREHWFEDEHLKALLKGSLNICRYHLRDVTKRLIFPYELINGKSVLIDLADYKRRYPLTWSYIEHNEPRLKARNKGQMGTSWHGYVYKKNHTRFGFAKLLVPSLATGSCFAADIEGQYYFVGSGGGGGGGYGIVPTPDVDPLYLLGLLNSRVLSSYLRQISTTFRGGYIALNRQYIKQMPIVLADWADRADRTRHDRMISLVQSMLDLHKQLAAAKTPTDKTAIQRQVDATDRRIDRLVYELYDLTDDEIRIVEEATK